MAFVDAKYNFNVVDIGAYDKSSDGSIFTYSNLGKAIDQSKLCIPQSVKFLNTSTEFPCVFIRDEVFPLTYI